MLFRRFLRSDKRHHFDELELLRRERTEGIGSILPVFGLILMVSLAFLASLIVLTPLFGLHRLEQEKETAKAALRQAQDDMIRAHDEYIWMQDPEYFEQIARDRANLAKVDEIIIRRPEAIKRAQ